MNTNFLSTSPDETFQLGETIGKSLKGNEILLLSGDLGAGKTLFTKGIAHSLGIDPLDVVSPSYTLMNQFQGKYALYHIDLYRLGDESGKKIRDMGDLDDYIGEGVMVVEWAQFLDDSYFKLKQTVDIRFHITPEDQRKITIKTSLQ
ncbi:MAG: tRNA (adenosine(37)-N6)-threonylcarbamoyltransferase complex ATPase subunit type 1 TsaE [bacterium]|nr:tRNA (adenosine(37)-N6)-threonylcarbamoyltransferase complex ATPase subunit type 1 TsaE [bacterium]